MFSNIGLTEFLLIAIVALLVFGPNKLPELGRALGKTLREFKNGARELVSFDDQPGKPEAPNAVSAAPAAGVASDASAASGPVVAHEGSVEASVSNGERVASDVNADNQPTAIPNPVNRERRLPD